MEQKPCSFMFKDHYLRSWKGIQNVSISLRTNGHETAIIAISSRFAVNTLPREQNQQKLFEIQNSEHSSSL